MVQISEYIFYVVLLFVLSGLHLLLFDAKEYRKGKQKKEYTTSRILGWGNLVAGMLALAVFLLRYLM